jgi:hypothetical protein
MVAVSLRLSSERQARSSSQGGEGILALLEISLESFEFLGRHGDGEKGEGGRRWRRRLGFLVFRVSREEDRSASNTM